MSAKVRGITDKYRLGLAFKKTIFFSIDSVNNGQQLTTNTGQTNIRNESKHKGIFQPLPPRWGAFERNTNLRKASIEIN